MKPCNEILTLEIHEGLLESMSELAIKSRCLVILEDEFRLNDADPSST